MSMARSGAYGRFLSLALVLPYLFFEALVTLLIGMFPAK